MSGLGRKGAAPLALVVLCSAGAALAQKRNDEQRVALLEQVAAKLACRTPSEGERVVCGAASFAQGKAFLIPAGVESWVGLTAVISPSAGGSVRAEPSTPTVLALHRKGSEVLGDFSPVLLGPDDDPEELPALKAMLLKAFEGKGKLAKMGDAVDRAAKEWAPTVEPKLKAAGRGWAFQGRPAQLRQVGKYLALLGESDDHSGVVVGLFLPTGIKAPGRGKD